MRRPMQLEDGLFCGRHIEMKDIAINNARRQLNADDCLGPSECCALIVHC